MEKNNYKSIWTFKGCKNNVALMDEEGISLSYQNLFLETKKISDAVGTRCLVFCLCKNGVGSVLGYISFINHGIVPVMLSSNMDRKLLNDLMEAYRPSFIWIPKEQIDYFKKFDNIYASYEYALLKTDYSFRFPLHDDLALLLTTSGSTGSPKFVRQSYDNILANTRSIVEYLGLDATERAITTLPMNYTYGLSIINTHIYVGATLLLTDKSIMQKEFWHFFNEQKATSFGGVPYTYEMLDKLRFMRMDLPSLRTMTQAGGKLTPELHEKYALYAQDKGKRFVVMYGQSEATARMGYLPPDKAVEKKGSMGIAIPGGNFKLIDINGQEIVEPYMTGELVYEGKNVTMGYAECGEDLKKGDERNGVLVTGDMAQFDEDGYFYIVGRKKRFLKIYGNRVNLDETDRLIKGKFEIDVVCAGVDDHMFIFLTDPSISDEVKAYISQTTKINPVAFRTVVIDEIPKNDAGKIQYSALEKYYDI